MWDGIDLDMILENGDLLFKSLNQSRLLGADDLPQTGHSILLGLLEHEDIKCSCN